MSHLHRPKLQDPTAIQPMVLIIPAPTVTPIATSMMMNDPVVPVLGVGVAEQRRRGPQLDSADLVQPQFFGLLITVERC